MSFVPQGQYFVPNNVPMNIIAGFEIIHIEATQLK